MAAVFRNGKEKKDMVAGAGLPNHRGKEELERKS